MRATQLRPTCALPAAQGPSSLRAVHDAAPVCTRRQLHSGAVAALLLGLCPQAAVAAAADVDGSGRRRQTQQIEEAYDGYAGILVLQVGVWTGTFLFSPSVLAAWSPATTH